MGTRSIIAMPNGDGWKGRYVHWDGYPQGVGQAIMDGYDAIGLEQLIKRFVIDEKIGWAVLAGADFTLDATWEDYGDPKTGAPLSYTARGEELDKPDGTWFTSETEHDSGCEWVYVCTEAGLLIYQGEFGAFGMGGGGFKTPVLIPWTVTGDNRAEILKRVQELDPTDDDAVVFVRALAVTI